MKRAIALIFVLAFIASSCEQTHFKREIGKIDSLLVKLDTVELTYRRIDTAGAADLNRKFSENLSFVQQAYINAKDTMPKDVALLMSDYRTLKKPAKGFIGDYQKAGEELKFSKNQLTDLKHDLQNNLLDSILVHDMLEDEMKAVESVGNSVQSLKLSREFTRAKRGEIEPRIDSLIQVLKQDES
ncbi:MAG: hypothetical protein WBG42_04315 [Cryomorphaceae bacterium]